MVVPECWQVVAVRTTSARRERKKPEGISVHCRHAFVREVFVSPASSTRSKPSELNEPVIQQLLERGRSQGFLESEDVRKAFEEADIPLSHAAAFLRSLSKEGVTVVVTAADSAAPKTSRGPAQAPYRRARQEDQDPQRPPRSRAGDGHRRGDRLRAGRQTAPRPAGQARGAAAKPPPSAAPREEGRRQAGGRPPRRSEAARAKAKAETKPKSRRPAPRTTRTSTSRPTSRSRTSRSRSRTKRSRPRRSETRTTPRPTAEDERRAQEAAAPAKEVRGRGR